MAILEVNDIASGYGEVQILWGSSLALNFTVTGGNIIDF